MISMRSCLSALSVCLNLLVASGLTFNHTASIRVVCEDLPEPENRVNLDPVLEDSSGLPAPQIHYRVSSNPKNAQAGQGTV